MNRQMLDRVESRQSLIQKELDQIPESCEVAREYLQRELSQLAIAHRQWSAPQYTPESRPKTLMTDTDVLRTLQADLASHVSIRQGCHEWHPSYQQHTEAIQRIREQIALVEKRIAASGETPKSGTGMSYVSHNDGGNNRPIEML